MSVSVPVQEFVQVVGITPEININRRKSAPETTFEVFRESRPSHEIDKLGARVRKYKGVENSFSLAIRAF